MLLLLLKLRLITTGIIQLLLKEKIQLKGLGSLNLVNGLSNLEIPVIIVSDFLLERITIRDLMAIL
jgi:hypothetical protein